MSNRYNRKGDKIKWAFTGIAFVLVFVMLAGLCLQLFAKNDKYKPSKWLEKLKPEQTETVPEDNGGAIVNESENNGISVMSAKLLSSEYAANGISEQAETAYQLTAIVTPSDSVLSGIDWSVAWVNAESEWATGKTVTDYVTVTPTSDGALTANVECKQAFGEQINVHVVCRDDNSKTADCTVDYRKKVVDIGLGYFRSVGVSSSSYKKPFYASNADITGNRVVFTKSYWNSFARALCVDTIFSVYSDYTIDDTFTNAETFKINIEYINYLKSGGITVKDDIKMSYNALSCGRYFFSSGVEKNGLIKEKPLGIPAEQANEAIKIARQHTDIPAFSFTFKYSSEYSSYEKTYDFYFAESSLEYVVDNLTLNESSLVF